MNVNPILKNYKTKLLYSTIWILVISIQIVVVLVYTNLNLEFIIFDTIIFNFLFAFGILPLWYSVGFNPSEGKKWTFQLFAHFVQACLLGFLCLSVGTVIIAIIFSGQVECISFLKTSLWWKAAEWFLFFTVAVMYFYLKKYIARLNDKVANEIRLNELLKDGELNLLKSQINPHFLFNGLNSVNYLIVNDSKQAQKMLVALSEYLRYAVLSTKQTFSILQDEMENINRYMAIEKLRFGEKIMYETDIAPECLSLKIPSMLLQPLFENAIKHGVYESVQAVRINVKITATEQFMTFNINNEYDTENSSAKKGSGTGLNNIRERLRLTYGRAATLQINTENELFAVTLSIPLTVRNET